jgi:hypothetical protein
MRYVVTVILAAIGVMYFLTHNAHAQDFSCPPAIDVDAQKLSKNISGWRLFFDKINTRYQLETVSMYSGAPEGLASLVPDENEESYAKWKLYANGSQTYYLTCGYTNTAVQLTRPVPDTFTACRVDYETGASNADGTPSPYKVDCQ